RHSPFRNEAAGQLELVPANLVELAAANPDRARDGLALRARLHGGNPVSPVGPLVGLTRVPRSYGSGGRSPPPPSETVPASCLSADALKNGPVCDDNFVSLVPKPEAVEKPP